jgi:hypothetical protein
MPKRGFDNFLPVTEILYTVHAGLAGRKLAAACSNDLCAAALHFFQTAKGALVGGCVG